MCYSFNEIVPQSDGSFYSLGYSTKKVGLDNTSAQQISWRGELLSNGSIAIKEGGFATNYYYNATTTNSSFTSWPAVLVHSGSVVKLRSGHLLTTLYGHGSGPYRKWTTRPAVFFVRSQQPNDVRAWDLISQIDWIPSMGNMSDGPGEPSTARLADGRLMVVFRGDSMSPYYKAYSGDEGVTWSHPQPMMEAGSAQWSVKPRLRVVPAGPAKGVLILTGGRPGIFLWASADHGSTWSRFNVAVEHNKAEGVPPFPPVVTQCQNFSCHRASPPATSSYTGVAFDQDGTSMSNTHKNTCTHAQAHRRTPSPITLPNHPPPYSTNHPLLTPQGTLLLSYDRLANGWHGPPGPWGQYDALFVTRVALSLTPGTPSPSKSAISASDVAPCDPLATPEVKQVLKLLMMAMRSGKILTGQVM